MLGQNLDNNAQLLVRLDDGASTVKRVGKAKIVARGASADDTKVAVVIEGSTDDLDDDGGGIPRISKHARPGGTLESLLRRCHELLIAPVAAHLEERLIIVPDQQLFALPFAALRNADGRHLVEHHTIRVSPSIGVLRQLGERRAARPPPAAGAEAT